MKRILALFLALCALLSLISCSSSIASTETAQEETKTKETTEVKETKEKGPITIPEGYSAGWARVVVNPDNGTGLGGYSNAETRLSTTILDDICLTATAISDGTKVFLLISGDFIGIGAGNYNQIAKIAESKFNIPPENIIVNATHTHASACIYATGTTGMALYLRKLYPAATELMETALRDLAPANLQIGEAHTQNLNYVRRYIEIKTDKFIGNWPDSDLDPTLYRHESQPDTQLQVIRFDRSEKKDIVICNWQCHPTNAGNSTSGEVSADWIGALRKEVEKNEDVVFSYHQGSSGNLVSTGKLKGDKNNSDYIAHGKKVAAVVSEALDNTKLVQWAPFQAEQVKFESTYNQRYMTENKLDHNTTKINLNVLSIGDVAFASVPCEYHDSLGKGVKENSPFQMTFMCAYSNGAYSYVPSKEACAYGGYEPNSYYFEVGTGEAWAAKLGKMLNTQYNNK